MSRHIWVYTVVTVGDEIEQRICNSYEEAELYLFAHLGGYVHDIAFVDKEPQELGDFFENAAIERDADKHITYACVCDNDIYIKEFIV